MPTYSYRCANCDFAFDQYQAFTDDSLTVCTNCGQSQLRKVFNSIGVTFNGSGFYRTDSRAKERASAASGGSKDSSSAKGEASSASSGASGSSADKPKKAQPATTTPAASSSSSSSSGSSSSSSSGAASK